MQILESHINKPYYIVEINTSIIVGFYDSKAEALEIVDNNQGYIVKRNYPELESIDTDDSAHTLKY